MQTIELNATNQSLGRLASKIALLLRGKTSANYTPNRIPDVEVVISNIDKIKFTGKKYSDKEYHRYSGYPGGLHTKTLQQRWEKAPREVVRHAVKRMLPVNRSRDTILRNLKFK